MLTCGSKASSVSRSSLLHITGFTAAFGTRNHATTPTNVPTKRFKIFPLFLIKIIQNKIFLKIINLFSLKLIMH